MTDMYEVVIVDRATGKVVQQGNGVWNANQADRIRSRMEEGLNMERFDVCVQRVADPQAEVDMSGELVGEGETTDGVQL